jgi:hypothetical protein
MRLSWCAENYLSGSRTMEIYDSDRDSRHEHKHTFQTGLYIVSLNS